MKHRRKIPGSNRLPEASKNAWRRVFVYALIMWMGFVQGTVFAAGGIDHDTKGGLPSKEPADIGGRPNSEGPDPGTASPTCRVRPSSLANFANGEGYDYSSMVTYLTAPECVSVAPELSQAAVSKGVDFSSKSPYRLDNFARGARSNSLESSKRLDVMLRKIIPGWVTQKPLTSKEMLPILGQVALLSPSGGRFLLGKVIEQELLAGDDLLAVNKGQVNEAVATNLARTLVRLGAAEGAIASEMAESVEEMALIAQADSLGKYFRALAAAASVEAALVPTFNLSAGAFNRGVKKGKSLYPERDNDRVLASVFGAIRSAVMVSPSLEPGAAELNEALGALLDGMPLTLSGLKSLWRDAIRVLSHSSTQTALADAVAVSLTPEAIFLVPSERKNLMTASRNYPQVAGAVQRIFLKSWDRMWEDLRGGELELQRFNRIKNKYFEPMVGEILDWNPYLIDSEWLGAVVRAGLVKDEDVEKRFPRYVLAFLDRRDRASKTAVMEAGFEPTVSLLTEDFAVLWTLSRVHVPALFKWIKKYEP